MRWLLLTGFLFLTPLADAVESQCDYPGSNIKTEKTADAVACEKLCITEKECTRWVYVSGWGRCALRKGDIKKRTITLWSASKGEKPIENMDHSAKDYKKLTNITSPEDCSAQCDSESQCVAMTYIAGYRDCYLKTDKGGYRDKIFYCGSRNNP